jgi:hypothetical protein
MSFGMHRRIRRGVNTMRKAIPLITVGIAAMAGFNVAAGPPSKAPTRSPAPMAVAGDADLPTFAGAVDISIFGIGPPVDGRAVGRVQRTVGVPY